MTTHEEAAGTLVDQVAALDETAEASVAAERAEALKAYRELLARADRPKRGDAETLKAILATLGKTVADFEADLGVLAEARDLEAAAGQAEAWGEKRRAAQAAFEAADRAMKEAERQRMVEYYEISHCGSEEQSAKKAGEKLARLRARRRDLFGDA